MGLSRPKVEMARRMLSEALDEDAKGDTTEDGGEFVGQSPPNPSWGVSSRADPPSLAVV